MRFEGSQAKATIIDSIKNGEKGHGMGIGKGMK